MSDRKIYVSILADYNNGEARGTWIDVDGESAESLQSQINALLAMSKYPNVMRRRCKDCDVYVDAKWERCPDCGGALPSPFPSAEEWAIHDSEGFYGLVEEYTPLDRIVELDGLLEEGGEAYAIYANDNGGDATLDDFQDAFQGTFDSETAFAEQLLDEMGELDSIPEHLQAYFDYDAYARDLFIDSYWSERTYNGDVAVFARM